jgi:prepilin-type N-terminal cleavage/methylation domain-containing protein
MIFNRSAQPTHRLHGFTLIEMLVLIIIVAVISSVMVPRYAQFAAATKFRRDVRRIAEVLAWARESAIENDTSATVQFDRQTETFVVTLDPNTPADDMPSVFSDSTNQNAQSGTPAPRVLTLEEYLLVRISPNSSQNSSNSQNSDSQNTLHFNSDGSCEGWILDIASPQTNSTERIVVSPTTGRITNETDAS